MCAPTYPQKTVKLHRFCVQIPLTPVYRTPNFTLNKAIKAKLKTLAKKILKKLVCLKKGYYFYYPLNFTHKY